MVSHTITCWAQHCLTYFSDQTQNSGINDSLSVDHLPIICCRYIQYLSVHQNAVMVAADIHCPCCLYLTRGLLLVFKLTFPRNLDSQHQLFGLLLSCQFCHAPDFQWCARSTDCCMETEKSNKVFKLSCHKNEVNINLTIWGIVLPGHKC